MSRRILTLADKSEWGRCIGDLPTDLQDVYYLPEYYSLFESEISRAECFTFSQGDSIVVYPYQKTHINKIVVSDLDEDYYDIEGAYGYNGFVSNSDSEVFLSNFAEEFSAYCLESNIVAEFTRFNPVLENHRFARHLDPKALNRNVIVDLEKTEEELWSHSYEHAARKNVNRAKRSGLTVQTIYGSRMGQELIDSFYAIYLSTMERKMAENAYYWASTFFCNINGRLNGNSLFLFTMTPEGKAISAEVILLSKNYAYSFLGGTLSEYYPERPNNILKHEAILALKKIGVKKFCLGGGTTPDDGIFKYKRTFAKSGVVDFYVGKKIHNLPVYDILCKEWETRFPEKAQKYSQYLLKYRQ
jgi:hypothetical protein